MEGAKQYVDSSGPQQKEALDVMEEFADDIANMHGRCFDIGCGPGSITKDLLLPRLPSDAVVVGADISKEMLDYARKNCSDEDRLSFIELNFETDELPNKEIGQYDNGFSFYCLNWCQNTKRACENMYALLRPGGRVLMYCVSFNDVFDVYAKMQDDSRYMDYMKDVSKYVSAYHDCKDPRATLKKTLQEVGFEVLHCSNREKWYVHANIQILRDYLMAVNPFYKKMPIHLQKRYKEDLMQELIGRKIIFKNKNGNALNNEYSVLDKYGLLIAYVRKPKI